MPRGTRGRGPRVGMGAAKGGSGSLPQKGSPLIRSAQNKCGPQNCPLKIGQIVTFYKTNHWPPKTGEWIEGVVEGWTETDVFVAGWRSYRLCDVFAVTNVSSDEKDSEPKEPSHE